MPKALATASADRLLHHAHVLITEEASLPLTEVIAGRGALEMAYIPGR